MRKPILDALNEKILVIDGAMGTLLLNSGVPADSCFEAANLAFPDIIRGVHQAYIDAGADIIETNSFGGSPLKLDHYGLADQAYDLNKAAVELARSVAGDDHYVAASMGPCGKLLEPVGQTTFEEAYEGFAIQAQAFADGGADIVCIETMGDLSEIKAAVLAVKENTSLPTIVSITYDPNQYTMTGSSPYLMFVTLAAMGVDVIGTNCGLGPEGMLDIIQIYQEAKLQHGYHTFISAMPNAGLPTMVDNKTVYQMNAQDFSAYATRFAELGVSLLGGCCGTTPDHIEALCNELAGFDGSPPTAKESPPYGLSVLTSRNKCVFVSDRHLPLIIGERLNPTARKILAEDLLEQKTDLYYQEAKGQLENNPALLDVNVGYPGINEAEAMAQIVLMLTKHFDVPLCIDSSNPLVLERGLRAYPGKALINSVNGEDASLNAVLPLAKKYGAAVIGLTLDEKGIPAKADQRLAIARKIVARADALGISRNDIFIDTLVLAASSNQEDALETIKALTLVKAELGVKTSLGISNISHGLPKRKLINHVFIAMALGAGLDALIANPLDPFVHSLIGAASVINNRDHSATHYISNYANYLIAEPGGQKAEPQRTVATSLSPEDEKIQTLKSIPELHAIAIKVIEGDAQSIVALVVKARETYSPAQIMEQALLAGMENVGANFKAQRVFLPQVMASAEAMKKAFEYLKPFMQKEDASGKGTVIIATVKGDIHDIGKNIVAMMLENNGFQIIDLGKNVDSDLIIESAKKADADLICLSSLLTTTMPEMDVVKEKLNASGLKAKLMIGGAVVNSTYAKKIGADYAEDAVSAAEVALKILGK